MATRAISAKKVGAIRPIVSAIDRSMGIGELDIFNVAAHCLNSEMAIWLSF